MEQIFKNKIHSHVENSTWFYSFLLAHIENSALIAGDETIGGSSTGMRMHSMW